LHSDGLSAGCFDIFNDTASKGIGAGVALSLAKEGAAVAVNYTSDRGNEGNA
jgi:hypothetical protein